MRLRIDTHQDSSFFAPGNLPTQLAYSLSFEDASEAFVLAQIASPVVLLAASFYFESPITRKIVARYPSSFKSISPTAVFFINEGYSDFRAHGEGKIGKSPSGFGAYASSELVAQRATQLESLGVTGVRADVDISRAVASRWISSCSSNESNEIGGLIATQGNGVDAQRATLNAIAVASERQYDFIWSAIKQRLGSDRVLSKLLMQLQRKLADFYVEIMAATLASVGTTPLPRPSGHSIPSEGIGDLATLGSILRQLSIDTHLLCSDAALQAVLTLPETELVRRFHARCVATATGAGANVLDYYRAAQLAEYNLAGRSNLTDVDLSNIVVGAMTAFGLKSDNSFVDNIRQLERSFGNTFFSSLQQRFLDAAQVKLNAAVPRATHGALGAILPPALKLLFLGASPPASDNRMDEILPYKEYKSIERVVERVTSAAIALSLVPAIESGELHDVLRKHAPQLIHFSGHGFKDGALLFEKGIVGERVKAKEVIHAIALICPQIRCVFFNSCFSKEAVAESCEDIEYTIVMSGPVGDAVAADFSTVFYHNLALHRTVEESFEAALNVVRMPIKRRPISPALYKFGRVVREERVEPRTGWWGRLW